MTKLDLARWHLALTSVEGLAGRMARPAEIGGGVALLAGGGASYVTATTIFADGGIMRSSPGL
jgi:NAD(P)-dependent dehydrogenase (short-subunit alcohol dehydrogenase family)